MASNMLYDKSLAQLHVDMLVNVQNRADLIIT